MQQIKKKSAAGNWSGAICTIFGTAALMTVLGLVAEESVLGQTENIDKDAFVQCEEAVPQHRVGDVEWNERRRTRCQAIMEKMNELAKIQEQAMDVRDMAEWQKLQDSLLSNAQACGIPCQQTVHDVSSSLWEARFRMESESGVGTAEMDSLEVTAPAHRSQKLMAMRVMPMSETSAEFPGGAPSATVSVVPGTADQVAIDTDTGSWPMTWAWYARTGELRTEGVRTEEWVHFFERDAMVGKPSDAPLFWTQVIPTPWNSETKLIRIAAGAPSQERSTESMAFTWLVDTSGSMDSLDRLPMVLDAMELAIMDGGQDETHAIATYAGGADVVLEPTSDRQKQRDAIQTLRNRGAGGGTAGAAGLETALRLAQSQPDSGRSLILIASDGDFNIGENRSEGLEDIAVRAREAGHALHVLLVGGDNIDDRIGQALAQAGNGRGYYAGTLGEAHEVLGREIRKPRALADVKVRFEPNPAVVAEMRRLGLETRVLDAQEFMDSETDGGELAAGDAASVWYELTPRSSAHRYLSESRYAQAHETAGTDKSDELGFVRWRYREGNEEKEAQEAVMRKPELESLDLETRWLAVVVWAAERARNAPSVKNTRWKDIYAEAVEAEKAVSSMGSRSQRRARLELLDLVYGELHKERER